MQALRFLAWVLGLSASRTPQSTLCPFPTRASESVARHSLRQPASIVLQRTMKQLVVGARRSLVQCAARFMARQWMRLVLSGLISRKDLLYVPTRDPNPNSFHVGFPGWASGQSLTQQGAANFSLLHHLASFRLFVFRRQYMTLLIIDVTKLTKPTITALRTNQHLPDDDQVLHLMAKQAMMADCRTRSRSNRRPSSTFFVLLRRNMPA